MNRFFIMMGLLLIGIGLAALVWLYQQASMLFNTPEQVKLFALLGEKFKDVDLTMTGTMDGKAFSITMPESMLSIAYVMITFLVLGLLISIISTFVGNGVSLLKHAAKQKPEKENEAI